VRSSRTGLDIAPAATRLVAQFGFDELKLERIEIMMAVENYPSRRVAEKVGATLEGTLRRRLRLHEVQHDAYLFSLVR
jgi:RimJ/RimL family protein N-acetyltransferase